MTIERFKNNWQPQMDSYARFNFNLDLKELVQQIRADAIYEFKERLLDLCDGGEECIECVGGNCTRCLDNSVDYSSIVDLAEELKEKKNE